MCFLITAVVGLVLVQVVGWGLLWFGLSGLLGAFFYTGRPISYKYRSLGELMLGILCGPVIVMGAYYVGTRSWDRRVPDIGRPGYDHQFDLPGEQSP